MSYFAITSNQPRHIEFVKVLERHIPLSSVIVVPKNETSSEEKKFFKDSLTLTRKIYLKCSKDNLESDIVISALAKSKPKVGFIFGAPLISSKIHSLPEYGCVNIHTGLVQHYRGVDSTKWAVYNNELDKIGATLHYIDDSIDAGSVIAQKKIQLTLEDSLETAFFKTCVAGFDVLSENILDIINNKVNKIKLQKKGKLYQTKDMTPEIESYLESNYEKIIKDFVNENNSRSL